MTTEPGSWHDQDAFWELLEPFLFTMRREELAGEQVGQVVDLLGLAAGARVLDLPCGNGRHSLVLAKRGFDVTGVDRTRRYIEAARQKAEQRGLAAVFEVGDMREYRAPAQYDAVLNLFGSFGYFEDPADDMRVVENVLASLRPGGQFLIETAGKEIVARDFQARDWHEDGDLLVLSERKVSHDWGQIENRYVILQGGQRFELTASLRSFSALELASLVAAGGFAEVQVYGSLAGAPYDQEAERLVVVGRKAGVKG